MTRSLTVVCVLAMLSVAGFGQICTGSGVLLQNDSLPPVPVGPTAVSVVLGLCPGEAIGCVFNTLPVGQVVKVNEVAVGFFNAFGTNGAIAVVNVLIYDGITWNGGIPTMGNLVLNYTQLTMNSIQVSTHAINTVDLSTLPPVLITSGTMVLAFEMDINPNGSCSTGYLSNFGTDNSVMGGACSTPPQKNLVRILGQGWRDVSSATVSGIPLCGPFINGEWVMRACVESANPLQIGFLPNDQHQPGFPTLVQFFAQPANAGNFLFPVVSGTAGLQPIGGGIIMPVIHDLVCNLYFNDPLFKSVFDLSPPVGNYFSVIPATGTTQGIVNIPGSVNIPINLPFELCFIVTDPGFTPIASSDAATLTVLQNPAP